MSASPVVTRDREVVGAPAEPEYFSVRAAISRALLWLITSWIPQSWWRQICRWSQPLGTWLWSSWWRRFVVRIIAGWHLAGSLLLILAVPAWADPASGGALSPYFSWMNLKDSHGIDAWKFELSIDKGNASPGGAWRTIWAYIITGEYELFRFLMASSIWFITWVLSFEWLNLILTPIRTISESITSITAQFALTPLMLTIAGFTAAIWMVRGKFSTGIYDVLVSCVIAAAAVGILSNPVERMVGNDGLIMQARDAGLSIAAGLANHGDTTGTPKAQIDSIQTKLVDTFIRQPTQLINFGQVLDAPQNNGKCVKDFDDAYLQKMKEPSLGEKAVDAVGDALKAQTGAVGELASKLVPDGAKPEDAVKNAIRDCEGGDGGPMKDYADNPGPGQAMGLAFLILAGVVVMAFAVMLAGRLILAACVAIGNAVKSIPGIILAIAPGMRGQFWRTIANVTMALLQMVFAIVFLVGYVLVVQSLFAADEANLIRTVFFVDIFLVVGIVLFRRGVKALKHMSDNLAGALSKRPNAAPTTLSKSSPPSAQDVANMVYTGRQLYRGGKTVAKGASALAKGSGGVAAMTGKVAAHAAGSTATAGVLTAVAAVRTVAIKAKSAKDKLDSIADPDSYPEGKGSAKESAANNSARAAREAAVQRLSRAALADKAGIKHPVGIAPAARSNAARSTLRAGSQTTKSPDGQPFREYLTTSGAPVMLPSGPARRQRNVTPAATSTPQHDSSARASSVGQVDVRARSARLLEAAARASANSSGVRPSGLDRGQ